MRRSALPFALALPLVLAACRKDEITTYRIPKEKEQAVAAADPHHQHAKSTDTPTPATAAPSAPPPSIAAPARSGDSSMASTPVPTASGAGLAWSGPSHWQAKPASGMRKGTFTLSGEGGTADLAITAFPGDVGGEVANVNRWRGQLGLPPQAADEATRSIQRLEHNGLKIGLVEMANSTGGSATRVLGAMVPHDGATWFFKLTGPDALVAKEKPAFLDFLKTIKPAGAASR